MEHPKTSDITCRELISAEVRVHEGRHEEQTQWCGLPASEWCATDSIYVCSTHVQSRHDHHSRSLAPLTPANESFIESEQLGERRSGDERRQG